MTDDPESIWNHGPQDPAIDIEMTQMVSRIGKRWPRSPDGRDMLTQDETDAAIRFDLWFAWNGWPSRAYEIEELLGYRPKDPGFSQRGGIDSDEMVRLLAYRTWQRRDIDQGIRR